MDLMSIKPFLDYGIIAGLFIFLLMYVLKTTQKREEQMREENTKREERLLKESLDREMRLHETLNKFSEKYDLIHNDIKDIKEEINKRG